MTVPVDLSRYIICNNEKWLLALIVSSTSFTILLATIFITELGTLLLKHKAYGLANELSNKPSLFFLKGIYLCVSCACQERGNFMYQKFMNIS